MENLQRIIILILLISPTVISDAEPQRYLSGGSSVFTQQEVCGIQDKDELPDMHAAAPWAAALFLVEGDLFQNQLKPQYLNTAVFISKTAAIASGSKILAQQQSELQTKLQLYYGHRASGKQTLIKVRKVEPLIPSPQPLPLRVDTATSTRIQNPKTVTVKTTAKSTEEHAELYLLHLESAVDIGPFSRPLCVNSDIFQNKNHFTGANRSKNRLHLGGYATKNETNGPHVVYFSGDREWTLQSWDSNYMKIVMQNQQVSYGFLPKHFNPGSALTVKVNDQFYLAGILLRSSGSQTVVRSLEKFMEKIISTVAEDPPVQQQQQYLAPRPQVHQTQTFGQPSHYDTLNQGNNGGNVHNIGNGQVQYQPQQPNPQYSSTGEQISYLKEVEHQESQNPHESQLSQGHRESVRTTSRPTYSYLGDSTLRPSLSLRPTEIIQQRPQQPGYDQISNYGTAQNGHLSRTTQRTIRTSPYPQYVYHPDSQRPLQQDNFPQQSQVQYQPQLQQQQHQLQQYSPPQQTVKCSQDYLEGVDIECLSRQRGVSTADCIKNAPPSTRIRLSCKPHYVPLDGEKLIEKTCDASGNWLPRKAFACKLDCGNVDRTVPFIVHGSKTESEKWPWHAALFKKVNTSTYSYICGATLITRSILITAAHCVQNGADSRPHNMQVFKVVIGAISSELLANRKDPQAQEFNIKGIRVNEHYNPRTFEADIALIQLDKPVVLTEYQYGGLGLEGEG